jgi:Lipocalin-like domain
MRIVIGVLLAASTMAAQTIAPQPASTMSELMVTIIYPASDAIFYITTREPKNDAEWTELQGKALAVAESANLLMMPGRARDQDRWMADAKLMLDAGRTAYRAARAKDVAALEAVNDALYESCTSCHQHYRPGYGRRPALSGGTDGPGGSGGSNGSSAPTTSRVPVASPSSAATIEGRWKLLAAEDLRADGSVARLPWGAHPVGSIIVERGACYLQIMSSDTPSFAAAQASGDQMKATLLSSYIAYSGPCVVDATAGSVTLKVEAAWRPDYVGTEQKRFFRFENGKLLFGPAPNSIRSGTEPLTRRLTLERVP